MKPYNYTAELNGRFDTRHEAIGQAANYGRVAEHLTVMGATTRVYAFEPYYCGYCGETFLYEDAYDTHQPCPEYVEHYGEPEETDHNA